MATFAPRTTETHEVANQPPPYEDRNLYLDHPALVEGLRAQVEQQDPGGGSARWAHDRLVETGRVWGGEPMEWGRLANESPPRLRTHDRFGHRIDEVEFHPAYHRLMELSSAQGAHSMPWVRPRAGAHVARVAGALCAGQAEAGHGCPMTMTFAAIPALGAAPDVLAEWGPLLTADAYDGRLVPAAQKGSAKCGMAMTEKQGGSDVRANTTRAEPAGGEGEYLLTGHKWFCSAPMCDLFLVLARAEEGITCFAVPRVLPDGTRNVFRLQRLKDKLGNRSNASSEVEFDGTWARLVGEPGRGVATIIEMVAHTRLDCVAGSAAGMRAAVAMATWHAAHRSAFGRLLADQPLMRNVLADLALESEAATALALRLARAYDEGDTGFRRLATAVGKYWVCKRQAPHAVEAMEVLGGNGYVEESGFPRLVRESPLNSIWEGSGNVNALDVLRALARQPEALGAYLDEVELARGADARLDAFVEATRAELSDPAELELRARRVVERLALALQGSLLVRHAPAAVADAFCASRLAGDWGHAFGTLPAGTDTAAIVERARPQR